MDVRSIKFRKHRCFQDWAGFEAIKTVNVIIGRNNTGKSALLDLVSITCGPSELPGQKWEMQRIGIPTFDEIHRAFPDTARDPDLGFLWEHHGKAFLESEVTLVTNAKNLRLGVSASGRYTPHRKPALEEKRMERLRNHFNPSFSYPLLGKTFRRLVADRDIRPEGVNGPTTLGSDGQGATNTMRRIATSSLFDHDLIQQHLRDELNKIFGLDGHFTRLEMRHHDDNGAEGPHGSWELYLTEKEKGRIALSSSGSGLKTVILVLLNLHIIPVLDGRNPSEYVFGLEELENNLHPALLRRLLQHIEDFAVQEKCHVFLTTHSSVALDLFGASQHAQIIHVFRDESGSVAVKPVSAHFDHLSVVSALGARPSDLLQANGIIWVEGPSDAVYLNRWIELFSDGRYRAGRDYQCAFYGGSVLARVEFTASEEETAELVNLLRVNPNVAVVCDGDRTAESGEKSELKGRVQRIKGEVGKVPGAFMWITQPKEIESYLSGQVLGEVFGVGRVRDPDQFEVFFPSEAEHDSSYLEKVLGRRSFDKTQMAVKACSLTTKEALEGRFDLGEKMKGLIACIERWNR